jgi:hypothetical protein
MSGYIAAGAVGLVVLLAAIIINKKVTVNKD